MSASAIDRLGDSLGHAGAWLPIVAWNVARNMRTLGVYSPAVFSAYFANLGRHFAGALHALRCATVDASPSSIAELQALAAERIVLGEEFDELRARRGSPPGAIIVSPHVANYLLFLARINAQFPLTVYLRYSEDPRRRALKERWYRASGVSWISEPADARGPLGRLGQMATVLRHGHTLYITPDLPQKRENGTPLLFFGREVYLPSGAAYLAVRTQSPLYFMTARAVGTTLHLGLQGPLEAGSPPRGRAARDDAVRARMQWFASHFERFILHQPALWYLWGDKRWTRLLADDPRYMRPAVATCSPTPLVAGVS